MNNSSEVDKLTCDIRYESIELDSHLNIMTCCVTPSTTSIHIICSPCMEKITDECPFSRHKNPQSNKLTITLNAASLVECQSQLPLRSYLSLLKKLHIDMNYNFSQAREHQKSFIGYFLDKTNPEYPIFLATISLLIKEEAINPTHLLSADHQFDENKRRLVALAILHCAIMTMPLALSHNMRSTLWGIKNYLPQLLSSESAKALLISTNPDCENKQLLEASGNLKRINPKHSLIGLAFMAKIQIKLADIESAATLCKSILLTTPIAQFEKTNKACKYFAYQKLIELQQNTHGAYLLFHTKLSQTHDQYLCRAPSIHPIDSTIKAITTTEHPCVSDGITYLLTHLPEELDKELLKKILSMTTHLLSENRYCPELIGLLDRYQLTPLFQKPDDDYEKTGYILSLFKKTPNDLIPDFANALISENMRITIQKKRYVNFFERLKESEVSDLVLESYREILQALYQKNESLNFDY